MTECTAQKEMLEREFQELMEAVRGDVDMHKVWKLRNRSVGVYQRDKYDFERKLCSILRERSIKRSYAAQWGQSADMSVYVSLAKHKVCTFVPMQGPCYCSSLSSFSHCEREAESVV